MSSARRANTAGFGANNSPLPASGTPATKNAVLAPPAAPAAAERFSQMGVSCAVVSSCPRSVSSAAPARIVRACVCVQEARSLVSAIAPFAAPAAWHGAAAGQTLTTGVSAREHGSPQPRLGLHRAHSPARCQLFQAMAFLFFFS